MTAGPFNQTNPSQSSPAAAGQGFVYGIAFLGFFALFGAIALA